MHPRRLQLAQVAGACRGSINVRGGMPLVSYWYIRGWKNVQEITAGMKLKGRNKASRLLKNNVEVIPGRVLIKD